MRALQNQVPPLARPNTDHGAAGASMEMPYVTLHFRPSSQQQASLDRLLTEQRDPSSPNYHRWLSPEEFGDHFGLSEGDIGMVANWLRDQGFRILSTGRGRRSISFAGTAAQVQKALRTEIHRYQVGGKLHYANSSAPQVPAAFAEIAAGFLGLDDFDPEVVLRRKPSYTTATGHFLTPEDVATIYNIRPLYDAGIDGSGQNIAIIGRTFVDLSDYRKFRRRFNLPDNDPTLLVVPGSDPGAGAFDDIDESNLDLQWAGAIAPKANIFLVYARSVFSAAQYAVDQNIAPVINLSYGGCEQAFLSSTVSFLRGVAQQANAQGITWVASTGDVGAAGCERQEILTEATRGLAVQIPAALPEVTAVGGTEFDEGGSSQYWRNSNTTNSGSATGYIPEKAWNDSQLFNGLASSTGGLSTLFPKPAWQRGPGVPAADSRAVPDLAFAASWDHDAWLTYVDGTSFAFGGTSVAAPVFAGVLTLLNQALTTKGVLSQPGLGNVNPVLYRMAQSTTDVFHDIVNGDNIVPCPLGSPDCVNGQFGYSAGPGYDLATGLGSIDVSNFVNRWNTGTASATSVTASPSSVPYDGMMQLAATVSGGDGPVTGTVNFISGDNALGSAVLSAGSASLAVSAFKLPAGDSTVTAVYAGNDVLNSSAGSSAITVTVPASGSAVVPSISPDPIYSEPPIASGYSWFFTITLSERAGFATTLTGLRIFGADYSTLIGSFFGTATIPAFGSIRASLGFRINNPPTTALFVFIGKDASGQQWTQHVTALFLPKRVQEPWVTVATAPGTADSQVSADPSCQLQDRVTLVENAGNRIDLSKFKAGGDDLTPQIQQIFGTTHLAPFGTLFGSVCWGAQPSPAAFYLISGTTENGEPVSAIGAVTAASASPGSGSFTASPASVSMAVGGPSELASAAIDLSFGVGAPRWLASSYRGNRLANWLTVSPPSGSGPARIALQASGAGLSPGVYNTILTIQAQGTLPQWIDVPISFVVGAGGAIQIQSVANGASLQAGAAPGMMLSVFGSNLAPDIQAPPGLPLPITMLGVTATVNGVTAPLYRVAADRIDLQIPYETGSGPAFVGINNNGQVASYLFTVSAAAPGIFTGMNGGPTSSVSGSRGASLRAFVTGQGDVTPSLLNGKTAPRGTPASQLPIPRLPVSVTVGGIKADVSFAGMSPSFCGIMQVDFTVPADAPGGDQPLVVTVGGVASAPATLTVTN